MNLRDLKYVVALADLRSFSQAAERCFISQPTLSAQLKKMEDSLGVLLFERTNKSVMPTEVGEAVIDCARRILREVQQIEDLAENARDPFAGKFRLGAFPTLASYLFPCIVARITAAFPRLKLLLMEEKTANLLDGLRTGRCDLALLALPVKGEILESAVWFEDPFLFAIPKNHVLAGAERIDPEVLHDMKLLLLDEGHCLRDQALEVCYQHGGLEEPDFRATSLETLRMMVKAGTGVTLMPKSAIRDDDPDIAYRPFFDPSPKRTIGWVWRKTSARRRLIETLIEVLKAEISESLSPTTAQTPH